MNILIKTCRTTAAAAAFAVAFGATPALLAQTQGGNTSDTASSSSGTSGTTGASSTSGASGTTSGSSGASGQAGSQQGSSAKAKSDQSAKSGPAKAPVYLLMPIDIATNDNAMKNGCWARLYSRENYAGDMLTLVGPSTDFILPR